VLGIIEGNVISISDCPCRKASYGEIIIRRNDQEVLNMKYLLLFCGTKADQEAFEAMSRESLEQQYAAVGRWFAENGPKIRGAQQLQGPQTATCVRFQGQGQSVITDGPFIEGNEVIGGYALIDVADLDEALAVAKTWPGGGVIEIRPSAEN
jgi:hypothetical protein